MTAFLFEILDEKMTSQQCNHLVNSTTCTLYIICHEKNDKNLGSYKHVTFG